MVWISLLSFNSQIKPSVTLNLGPISHSNSQTEVPYTARMSIW